MPRFWLCGVVTAMVLCFADLLPMPSVYPADFENFKLDCSLGPWAPRALDLHQRLAEVMIFGVIGTFMGLLCPAWRSPMCFVDVACIHQGDHALMRRGAEVERWRHTGAPYIDEFR